ncbi:MAG: response regulator transcription factor [Phycisphaerales bacterium]
MRLLLVEDSDSLRRSISQGLREAGYAVDAVGDGKQALLHGQTTDYDVIILDLMLPSMDGLTVLKKLREKNIRACVLILTARDSVSDRVLGLRSGSDDYLVKPFAFDELLARVAALARRAHGVRAAKSRVGNLELDGAAKSARVLTPEPKTLELAPREFAVLEYLMHRVGSAVSRAELEEHLYDERSQVLSNAIDVTISALRAKLEQAGCPPLIHTRRKIGYLLSESEP